jgi:beta-lactamase regulating signal transducer with metallopeptidase domain
MNSTLNSFADGLVNQSWQLSVVFAVVFVSNCLLRNASAHWRYLLWLTVIAKCLTPPLLTLDLPILPGDALRASTPQSAVEPRPFENTNALQSNAVAPPPAPSPHSDLSSSLRTRRSVIEPARPTPLSTSQILTLVWALITAVLLINIAARMWITHRRLKSARRLVDGDTQSALAALAATLGMKRPPRVHLLDSPPQPFVWGWLRGDIYLPSQFFQTGTPDQQSAILTHELAHVLRWDAAVNHLQNVLQAVFFFHPLVWWTNQKLRQERENCCDEIVLSASKVSPRAYCEAIVNVLASEYASRQSTPALAVTGSVKNIKDRVTTMLTPNRSFRRRPSRAEVATTLLIAACVLPTTLVVTKANEKADPAAARSYSFGGRLEILALGTHDEQAQKWWDAEGRPLATVPFTWQIADKTHAQGLLYRKVVVRIHDLPEDARINWSIPQARTYAGGSVLIDGKKPPEYLARYFGVPKDCKAADFKVGVAAGPWKTLTETNGSTAQGVDGLSIVTSEVSETASGAFVIVSHDCFDRAVRLAAVDKQGAVHPQIGYGGTSAGKIYQVKAEFPKLTRADIDHFEFQVRDYEWIELKNVPLEPAEANNFTTRVQTEKQSSSETPPPGSPNPPVVSTWKPGQTMDLQVINLDTNEPLADVTLELQNMGPGINFQDVKTQKTDSEGRSRIPFPDLPPTQVRIYPVKAGFVPLRVYWEGEPHPTLPTSLTIPMEPAKKFGGLVRNESGEPIPDVKVNVHYWAAGMGKDPHIRANIDTTAKTDNAGRWSVEMPAEINDKDNLRIFVNHPGYVSDVLRRGWHPIPVTPQPVLSDLYSQTAVMTMREGNAVEGMVVDMQGQPIPDVKFYDTEYYWFGSTDFTSGKPRATTDKSGKFRITGVTYIQDWRLKVPGDRGLALTVQARGFAPEIVSVSPDQTTLKVQLKPGRSAHGRVVDEAGKPVEGVRFTAGNWREWHSRLNIEAVTDVEGRFTLNDLPADGAEFGFSKEGYEYVSNVPLSASDKEYKFTLRAPVRIVGLVVDADTGTQLDKFTLMTGTDYEDGRAPSWNRWAARTLIKEGRFETTLKQAEFAWRLRVEAEGYLPAVSRIFRLYKPDQGEVIYDFQLTKAPGPLTGIAVLKGKPLAGADVYLATDRVNLTNRKVTYSEKPPVKTDIDGSFPSPPEGPPCD